MLQGKALRCFVSSHEGLIQGPAGRPTLAPELGYIGARSVAEKSSGSAKQN